MENNKPKQKKEKKEIYPKPEINDLVNMFINIYFTAMTNKNLEIIENLVKEPKTGKIYTKINYMQKIMAQEEIIEYFEHLFSSNIEYNIKDILTVPKGERYISILVTGEMKIELNSENKNFVQYFNIETLWNAKEKLCNYWIESIMHTYIF